nr:MAG TPA: hypothetical protein [Caudoviricetes sp.]
MLPENISKDLRAKRVDEFNSAVIRVQEAAVAIPTTTQMLSDLNEKIDNLIITEMAVAFFNRYVKADSSLSFSDMETHMGTAIMYAKECYDKRL